MPSAFLSGAGAAAGIAMINSIGNLGGFVGPFAIGWLKHVTGGYAAGLYVVAGTLAVSAIVTLMLSRKASQQALVSGCGTTIEVRAPWQPVPDASHAQSPDDRET